MYLADPAAASFVSQHFRLTESDYVLQISNNHSISALGLVISLLRFSGRAWCCSVIGKHLRRGISCTPSSLARLASSARLPGVRRMLPQRRVTRLSWLTLRFYTNVLSVLASPGGICVGARYVLQADGRVLPVLRVYRERAVSSDVVLQQ